MAATYTIPLNKCYDSLSTGIPMFWNDEHLRNEPYPNPSNGTMVFPLEIKQAGIYDLRIYDLNGSLRKFITKGITLEPGIYHVQWDGIDDTGAALENGIFTYVVSQDNVAISNGTFLIR